MRFVEDPRFLDDWTVSASSILHHVVYQGIEQILQMGGFLLCLDHLARCVELETRRGQRPGM